MDPGFWSVEMEVKRNLRAPEDFMDVLQDHKQYFFKASGLFRDSLENDTPSWVVRDGNYVSARWPGDTHAFARAFVRMDASGKIRASLKWLYCGNQGKSCWLQYRSPIFISKFS